MWNRPSRFVFGFVFVCGSGAAWGQEAESKLTFNPKLNGDLRYRYETIHIEGGKTRARERVRARIGITAPVNDKFTVNLALGTGGENPTSANQDLTGGFSRKAVGFDLANIAYKDFETFNATVGKFRNPLTRVGNSQLVWDADLNPEGIAASYDLQFSDFKISPKLASFSVAENPKAGSENDIKAHIGQLVFEYNPAPLSFLVGGSVYKYTNMKDSPILVNPERSFGNTINADKTYTYNYNLQEYFTEVGFNNKYVPIRVYYHAVTNSEVDEENDGWLGGIRLGSTENEFPLELSYNYRKTEKDAVVGAMAASNFGGGGSNNEGHLYTARYLAVKNVELGLTVFNNETPVEHGIQYTRVMSDLLVSF